MTTIHQSDTGHSQQAARDSQDQAFSVTVGRDSWAGQVIDNVVGSETEETETVREDPVSVIENKILQKKRLFHASRCLELKNLPDGVREEDITAAFPDLEITSITIEKPDVRVKAGARLRLGKPEVLDCWPVSRQVVFICNKEVSVCVGSSEGWLCVARLPPDTREEEFSKLVSSYGVVGESFLVVSEVTGAGKGYGVVRYVCSQAAAQARHLLANKTVRGYSIQVDWLASTHISYSQLHSKCLYIDNLPPNYRDMNTFRNIFSVVKNPPYCQIAMKNGVIQDWGLVEFFDSTSAEVTQQKLDGHRLKGQKIRVHYCIPGVNAINIYMAVVNSKEETKKKALLEDTPSSSVYTQLQKLASQNPAFAQNLETIIQTQINSIRTGGSSSPASVSSQEQNQRPKSSAESDQQLINSNAQAALMILLTAQSQSSAGEMSLLSEPEVQSVLENLVCSEKTVQDPYSALTRTLGAESSHSRSPPPVIANNMNMLSNTSSLNQLLGIISSGQEPPAASAAAVSPSSVTATTSQQDTMRVQPGRPALMTLPPPPTSHQQQQQQQQQQQHQQHHHQQQQQQQLIQQQQQLLQHQHQQLLAAQLAAVGQLQGAVYQQVPPVMLAGPGGVPGLTCTGPPPAPFFVHPGSVQPLPYTTLPLLPMVQPNALDIQLPGLSSPLNHSPVPRISASSPATTVSCTPSPVGLKRKASIPPSPEASPQGPYIGQHSQGLGGHYADSYWAKKRLKQSF